MIMCPQTCTRDALRAFVNQQVVLFSFSSKREKFTIFEETAMRHTVASVSGL